ncbi:hypothetical protein DUNSADRAFT_10478 [Dunaliella salina]|uniref:Uncharacterized protein n=1 Tax=Dunaliella salina TaxID=3046 RepID=A0ABQ7GFA1_DUNSA|nr:hypothetical protein DUNSADRAFT_10478 [Dunaliella salina]|eukprot:KAF5833278.1 hypothetical protein DUNSADRAFT_10478 [Dunaliella salina]
MANQPKEWMVNHTRDASTVADLQALAGMNSLSLAALEKTSTQYGSVHDNASEKMSKMSNVLSPHDLHHQQEASANAHVVGMGSMTSSVGKGRHLLQGHGHAGVTTESQPKQSYNERRAHLYLKVRNRRMQFCLNVLLALVVTLMGVVTGALRLSGEQVGAEIAMIVLGGIAGAVMVMHCVMAAWDLTELALEDEKLNRQQKKGPLCNAV